MDPENIGVSFMINKKLKIAITGRIGSGKSILTEYYEGKGFPIIRSDIVAKELMNHDLKILKRITAEFGNDSYIDGKLNTNYLSEVVFNDEEKVKKINSIIHPVTTTKVNEMADKHLVNNDLVFIESALVFEAKITRNFDYIILVTATEELRIQRTILREKIDEFEVRKRMKFQLPDESKIPHVDFVIENNSTLEDFMKRGDFILSLLIQFAKT